MTRRYRSYRLQSSGNRWIAVIAAALLLHLALFLFFKPQYLRIFRTERSGDAGPSEFYSLDRPFSLIPLAEPADQPAAVVGVLSEEETSERSMILDELGEPSSELAPLPRAAGGGASGASGTRSTSIEPKPLFIPWPKYPAGVDEKAGGAVELLLYVNERGEVENVKVTKRLPVDILNQTAIHAARRMRFSPGMERGVPTAMWVRLTIGFQPR